MISSSGIVHVVALLALTIIVVVQIKYGKGECDWLPIVVAVAGYLMPQPKFRESATISFPSMDDDSGFALAAGAEPTTPRAVAIQKYKETIVKALPSVMLLATAVVWSAITLTSRAAPAVVPVAETRNAAFNPVRSPLDMSSCHVLLETARTNPPCNTAAHKFISLEDGKLSMCFDNRSNRGALKVQIQHNDDIFVFGYYLWRGILFRMSVITSYLYTDQCDEHVPIGYNNETVTACKERVVFNIGEETIAKLTAASWNTLMFRAMDVTLALTNCIE
jgi:hypothetical protein